MCLLHCVLKTLFKSFKKNRNVKSVLYFVVKRGKLNSSNSSVYEIIDCLEINLKKSSQKPIKL